MKKVSAPTASISFQLLPKAKNKKALINIIDRAIALVKASGVTFEVGPMETTMEGDLDQLIEILRQSQYLTIKSGATSVFTNVKIFYDPKGVMTIAEKVTKHR